jgi:hypothetical protein
MKYLLSLIVTIGLAMQVMAQNECATDEQHAWLMKHNAEYAWQMQNKLPAKGPYINARINGIPDTIPVVVHVVYLTNFLGTWGNISDSEVHQMMDNINRCFNDNTPGSANVGLYFKLAQTDPNCRLTTGILHIDASDDPIYASEGVNSSITPGGIQQGDLAAKSYWDNTKYLNIWIVHKINGAGGFAFFPSGNKTVHDGIVITYQYLGAAVHELGHAFNLQHSFSGSSGTNCPLNNDCNRDGDFICDTPPVPLNTLGCNTQAINPCTNQPYGSIVNNYMSYSCQKLFTPQQVDRMISALYTYRSSLLIANTEWPPPSAPSVTIKSDDADNIIDKGRLITFTPTVNGNPTIQYHWLKNKFEVGTGPIYSTNDLAHGDEIVCMIEDPALVCHVPVRTYSDPTKISLHQGHYVDVYPNPVYDLLTVWTPSDDIKISGIRLFSANGQLMDEKQVTPSSRVQYSLKNKPAGIYFIEFTTNKGKDVVKAVKVY